MRLAFCLYRYFPYSGLSRDFMRILREAQTRGHEVKVYAYQWQGEQPENIEVQLLPARALTNHGRNTHFYRLFLKAIDGEHFDAIVGFNKMPGLDIYYGADYCYIARAKPKYSPLYRLTPRFAQQTRFERAVFEANGKTTILSLSGREKSVYQEHYGTPESRFVMMPPTLDIARKPEGDLDAKRQQKRQTLGLDDSQKLILFIGSGFRTKGLERAILALAALPDSLRANSQLYVVGQDDTQPYQQQVKRLGLGDNVSFLGGRSDVPELMLAGDALLHPAISENTGTVILEALACGLPVIATDVCGYAPHIELADAGQVLRSPFSQSILNNRLQETLTSSKQRQWQNNGRRYGQNPALYRMPQTAVDAIEAWTEQHQIISATPPPSPARQNTLPPSLQAVFPHALGAADLVKINGTLIAETADYRIMEIAHEGHRYHLKTFSSTAWHTLIYHLLRLDLPEAGAQHEWHAAHHLERLGIRTARPLAWGCAASSLTNRHSYLIREPLPDNQSLADYLTTNALSANRKFSLLHQIAKTISNIHQSGAYHGALSLHTLRVITSSDEVSDEKITPQPISQPTLQKGTASVSHEWESRLALTGLERFKITSKHTADNHRHDLIRLYAACQCLPEDDQPGKLTCLRFIRTYHDIPLRQALQQHGDFWRMVDQQAAQFAKLAENTHRQLFDLSHPAPCPSNTPLRSAT